MIDIHCHILPSIDDGPDNIDESIEMAKIAEADGIKKIVATPHQLEGLYQPKPDYILAKIEELNNLLKERGCNVEILPGSDAHISHDLISKIESNEVFTLNRKNHILLEFPNQFVSERIKELLSSLVLKRITPVISHPERNLMFQRTPNLLFEMIEIGALSQITAMSVIGEFGYDAKKSAKKFISHRMVHFVASDAHSSVGRTPEISICIKHLKKIISEDEVEEILFTNPELVILGKSVYPRKAEKIRSFFGFFG